MSSLQESLATPSKLVFPCPFERSISRSVKGIFINNHSNGSLHVFRVSCVRDRLSNASDTLARISRLMTADTGECVFQLVVEGRAIGDGGNLVHRKDCGGQERRFKISEFNAMSIDTERRKFVLQSLRRGGDDSFTAIQARICTSLSSSS